MHKHLLKNVCARNCTKHAQNTVCTNLFVQVTTLRVQLSLSNIRTNSISITDSLGLFTYYTAKFLQILCTVETSCKCTLCAMFESLSVQTCTNYFMQTLLHKLDCDYDYIVCAAFLPISSKCLCITSHSHNLDYKSIGKPFASRIYHTASIVSTGEGSGYNWLAYGTPILDRRMYKGILLF